MRIVNRVRVAILTALLGTMLGASGDGLSPSSAYNLSGQARTRTCAAMQGTTTPLRFPDGTPTGFYARGDDPSMQGRNQQDCPPGSMELDAHEVLKSGNGMQLYFHPGGGGDHYKNPVEDGQYGHVAIADLKSPPKIASKEINGKPSAPSGQRYFITPTRIPLDMYYKPNVENGRSGSTYYTYGNPGYDKTGGRGDWTYINWSWVQNGKAENAENITHGGGMVRALGKRDAIFGACDVEPIVGYSYGKDNQINGRVTAFYGKTTAGEGGSDIFGWMPHSYQKIGDIIIPCVRRMSAPADAVAPPLRSSDRMERMATNLVYGTKESAAWRAEVMKRCGDSDPAARMEAMTELSRADDAETVNDFLKLLSVEQDSRVREQAIVLIGFLASTPKEMKEIAAGLAENFKRASERERLSTIEIVSNIPAPESVTFIRALWEAGGASAERLALADGISKLAPRAPVEASLVAEANAVREKMVRTRHPSNPD